MEIWLSNGTKDKLQLPVNPEDIGFTDNRNFEDIVLASGDEKTIIVGKNQKDYTISSFFPKNRPLFAAVAKLKKPIDYVKKIESWMDSKKVLLFQATTTTINTQVTIRTFEWHEKGGAVGDIEYTLTLKEYKPVSFVKPGGSKTSKRPSSQKTLLKTYTVKKGDSLWKISSYSNVYGSGAKWPTIYNANKKVIGKNSNKLSPGQKLVIPR